MTKARFNAETATFDEWIKHLEGPIPALVGCKTNTERIKVINGHRGMLQGNSKLAQETFQFLTKVCKLTFLDVTPTMN